jgi:GGDEF domain-containing protein
MAVLRDEEARSRTIGEDACVLSIGVEGLDAVREREGAAGVRRMLCLVAEELAAATRDHDRVARTEDDGFGVLLSECRSSRIDGLIDRFYQGFAQRRLPVTIGGCGFRQAGSLARAWRVARDVRRAEMPGRA